MLFYILLIAIAYHHIKKGIREHKQMKEWSKYNWDFDSTGDPQLK